MFATAAPTSPGSIVGSTAIFIGLDTPEVIDAPSGQRVADVDLAAGDVVARPSSAIDLVIPVTACLVAL